MMCEHDTEVMVEVGLMTVKGQVISPKYSGSGLLAWEDICPALQAAAGNELGICGSKRETIEVLLAVGAFFAGLVMIIAWVSTCYRQLQYLVRAGALLSAAAGICATAGTAMWPSLISEALGAADGEDTWRDCHNVLHIGVFVGLNGHSVYNNAHNLLQAWGQRAKADDGQIDVYEHTPRCSWGISFMLGVAVAVLSCCQICCFLNGNDITDANWDYGSDGEYDEEDDEEGDEEGVSGQDDSMDDSTGADTEGGGQELADVASGKVLV
jgi:hypothetical protein